MTGTAPGYVDILEVLALGREDGLPDAELSIGGQAREEDRVRGRGRRRRVCPRSRTRGLLGDGVEAIRLVGRALVLIVLIGVALDRAGRSVRADGLVHIPGELLIGNGPELVVAGHAVGEERLKVRFRR